MRNCKSDFARISILVVAVVCLSFTPALAHLAISGNAGLVGSPGTTLTYFDGTLKTIVADSTTGDYEFLVLDGWSGTVTPSRADYVFNPTHLDFINVTASSTGNDFLIDSVTISGNTGVAGTILTYGTDEDTTVTADESGDYSYWVPYDWSGTLTPSMTGYTFLPDTLVFANVLMSTDTNDFTPSLTVNIEQDYGDVIPKEYSLGQNRPNPFNPSTVIHFTIPRASSVSLKVYNIVGQEVAALLGSTLPAGGFWTTWDGRDKNGMTVSSGVYFYRLQAGDYAETKKMLLMK
jgi:hypothetical protein